MSTSLIFLIATLVQKSGASRFSHLNGHDYNPSAQLLSESAQGLTPHGTLLHGPMAHGPWRAPHLQMQVPKRRFPSRSKQKKDPEMSDSDWKADLGVSDISGEASGSEGFYPSARLDRLDGRFPPAKLDGADATHLLDAWRFQATGPESLFTLAKMENELKKTRRLQAVGLIPDDPFMIYPSVMALALVSRGKLKRDPTGSLLKMVEAQFGIKGSRNIFGRRKHKVSVLTIKGLAEGTGASEGSARALLAKIAEWAQFEKRLVVVATDSLTATATEHYVELGFKRVMRDDGSYDFVYPGLSSNADRLGRTSTNLLTLVGLKLRS